MRPTGERLRFDVALHSLTGAALTDGRYRVRWTRGRRQGETPWAPAQADGSVPLHAAFSLAVTLRSKGCGFAPLVVSLQVLVDARPFGRPRAGPAETPRVPADCEERCIGTAALDLAGLATRQQLPVAGAPGGTARIDVGLDWSPLPPGARSAGSVVSGDPATAPSLADPESRLLPSHQASSVGYSATLPSSRAGREAELPPRPPSGRPPSGVAQRSPRGAPAAPPPPQHPLETPRCHTPRPGSLAGSRGASVASRRSVPIGVARRRRRRAAEQQQQQQAPAPRPHASPGARCPPPPRGATGGPARSPAADRSPPTASTAECGALHSPSTCSVGASAFASPQPPPAAARRPAVPPLQLGTPPRHHRPPLTPTSAVQPFSEWEVGELEALLEDSVSVRAARQAAARKRGCAPRREEQCWRSASDVETPRDAGRPSRGSRARPRDAARQRRGPPPAPEPLRAPSPGIAFAGADGHRRRSLREARTSGGCPAASDEGCLIQ
eukprot:TRINITY_DN23874_c2_g1_i1.p1 TRINITY_DN23874_c2_g1~~TRINITY_DN23874_c2_g1_i1.p1  ORF type:complete len:498 (+),score=108.46 TRINITY_DN23874_c2_g1_i1:71-1564(+)